MAFLDYTYTLAGLVILSLTIGVWQADAQPYQEVLSSRSEHQQALREAVQRQGQFPVLVRLSDDAVLSASSSPGGKAGPLPSNIARAQQRVLSALPKKATSVRRFRYIPFIAVQADLVVLDALMSHTDVAHVYADAIYESMLTESTSVIGANTAWEYGGTGEGQVVAVLDTGVDYDHPFLRNKVVHGGCFSTNYTSQNGEFESISTCSEELEEGYGINAGVYCGKDVFGCDHGTRVAGIVAGKGETFSGVAKDADIMSVQVFSRFESYCGETPCARSWVSDQIAGLEYIYTMSDSLNIAAVNMSLGGGHYTSEAHCDEVNPAMHAVFELLRSKGIPVIAAAGNSGLADGLVAPACLSNAISVGSTSLNDEVSSFSNSAAFLDFWAPGQDVVTSVPGTSFQPGTGTSFAAPHVAGAWAILKSKTESATVDELKDTLMRDGPRYYGHPE